MLRWYLIHTKALGERVAERNLSRQGYEVYLPRVRQPARRGDRWQDRVFALFPRYLFLRLNEGQQSLAPVRSSVGVTQVVRFGQHYAVVPERIIEELRAHADPVSGLHSLRRPAALVSGNRVRIGRGIFEGLEGIFEREAGAERVIVLMRILGHDTVARVPAGYVSAAC